MGAHQDSSDSDLVAMLDLVGGSWAQYYEHLNIARGSFGCAAIENAGTVWVAGGRIPDSGTEPYYTAAIEYRFVHNPEKYNDKRFRDPSGTWTLISGTLAEAKCFFSMVEYNGFLLTLGGYGSGVVGYAEEIDIIDSRLEVVYQTLDPLYDEITSMTAIVVGQQLFAFGGATGSTSLDEWISFRLTQVLSSPPTSNPTTNPSSNPTTLTNPTQFPSALPSDLPTRFPTSALPTMLEDEEKVETSAAASSAPTLSIVIACAVGVCLCGVICLLVMYIARQKTRRQRETEANLTKMGSVSSTHKSEMDEHEHKDPQVDSTPKDAPGATLSAPWTHTVDVSTDSIYAEPQAHDADVVGMITAGSVIEDAREGKECFEAEGVGSTHGMADGLEDWITKQVELPQYLSMFVERGYETLQFVQNIESEQELEEIGVHALGHRKQLFKEILKLKAKDTEHLDSLALALPLNNNSATPSDSNAGADAMYDETQRRTKRGPSSEKQTVSGPNDLNLPT